MVHGTEDAAVGKTRITRHQRACFDEEGFQPFLGRSDLRRSAVEGMQSAMTLDFTQHGIARRHGPDRENAGPKQAAERFECRIIAVVMPQFCKQASESRLRFQPGTIGCVGERLKRRRDCRFSLSRHGKSSLLSRTQGRDLLLCWNLLKAEQLHTKKSAKGRCGFQPMMCEPGRILSSFKTPFQPSVMIGGLALGTIECAGHECWQQFCKPRGEIMARIPVVCPPERHQQMVVTQAKCNFSKLPVPPHCHRFR